MQIGRGMIIGLTASLLVAATAGSGSSVAAAGTLALAQASAAEIEFWRSVGDSKKPAELAAYLKAYPNGQFAPLARIRLEELKGSKQQSTAGGNAAAPTASSKSSADTDIPPAPPHKRAGWIGVAGRDVTEARARELGLAGASGVEIQVVPQGPAAQAGLASGDVVLVLNGEPVVNTRQFAQLGRALAADQVVDIEVMRGGRRQSHQVALGDAFQTYWSQAHRGDRAGMRAVGAEFYRGSLIERDYGEAAKWFRRAAEAGDAIAMRSLGHALLRGQGVRQDREEAVRWFRKAADAGDSDAMYAVGQAYREGIGVARDLVEAVRWFKLAAEKNHPGGLYVYGLTLSRGDGQAKNEVLAIDYFRKAVNLNFGPAFGSLGLAYHFGWGVKADMREAVEWYRRAADRGVPLGFFGLAGMHERGEGGLPKNRNEAIKNYRKAAELGSTGALDQLKKLNATPHDPQEVQQLLSDLGFDPGPIDGRPGAKTAQVIREFQKSRGLPVNGEASLALVGQLRNALKQKTAATTTTASTASSPSTSGADFGALKDLEKLDSLE